MSRKRALGVLFLVSVCATFGAAAAVAHSPAPMRGVRAAAIVADGSGSSGRSARHPAGNPFASAALQKWLANRHGRVTAAVYDIQTGKEYRYKPQYGRRRQARSRSTSSRPLCISPSSSIVTGCPPTRPRPRCR